MRENRMKRKGRRGVRVAAALLAIVLLGMGSLQAQTENGTINNFSALTGSADEVSVTIGGTFLLNEENATETSVRLGVQQAQMIRKHYEESGNKGDITTPVHGFFLNLPTGTVLDYGLYDSTSYAAMHYVPSMLNYDSVTTLILNVWPVYNYYDTLYLDSAELLVMNTPPLDPRVDSTIPKYFHAGENISYFKTTHNGDSIVHFIVFTCGGTARDVDGNPYHSVFIGPYCWTTSNMKAEHYSRLGGEAETMTYHNESYPDEAANFERYGHLYDWYAAVRLPYDSPDRPDTTLHGGFVTGICPVGWHIPESENIESLYARTTFSLMTVDGWIVPGGTNETGFSALPAGVYNPITGRFENLLSETHFWSVVSHDVKTAMICSIVFGCEQVIIDESKLKSYGLSVRCVKDQVYDVDGNVIAD